MDKLRKCAIIGLGHFGYQLSVELASFGIEVIAIDKSEKHVNALKDMVALAVKLDSTNIDSLEDIGINDCDCVIVTIGEDFADSLLTVTHLQELNVRRIISRVVNPAHEKILKKMNIDKIILPESVAAQQLAKSLSIDGIIESFEISKEYSIVEAKAPKWTISQSLGDLNLRDIFDIELITIIKPKKDVGILSLSNKRRIEVSGILKAETKIVEDDILLIFGKHDNIKKFLDN